ncbi:MAG: Beta-hexosaminidase A [bacterium]|nr:Beta-hexosaminidase A [bacterium]
MRCATESRAWLLSLIWCLLLLAGSGEQRADAAAQLPDFSQWTLEEQVGQLLIWGSTNRPEDLTPILEGSGDLPPVPIGGVLLTTKPVRSRDQVLALARFLRTTPATPVPPLLCADQEGGKVAAITEGVVVAPSALQLSLLPDAAMESALVTMIQGTHAVGVDVLLAPVIDIDAEPLNDAIGKHERSFGGDPAAVLRGGRAFVDAAWHVGAVPVLKHFPGHGYADFDSHLTLPTVQQSQREWLQLEGSVYRDLFRHQLLQTGPAPLGIMIAHLRWPALTGNDAPTGFSRPLLQQTLRQELGVGEEAVIWSDDLLMKALPNPVDSAIAMRRAGIDLLLVSREPATLRAIHKALVKYYREGWLDRADLEASLNRILLLKAHLQEHWAPLDPSVTPAATPQVTREPQPFF